MTQNEIVLGLADGLEARPVAMFVQIAGQYESHITVVYHDRRVNAKSIMGMMSLGIAKGETVKVIAEGPDEEEAIAGIGKYLSGNPE